MGCAYCRYWVGGEVKGVETCSATQKFRDGFCGIGIKKKNTDYPQKKKRRKKKK